VATEPAKPRSTARIGSSPASPVVASVSPARPATLLVKAEDLLDLSSGGSHRATRFPKSVDPG